MVSSKNVPIQFWAVVGAQVVAHRIERSRVQFPLGAGLFSLFSFSSVNQWYVLNQVPRGGASLRHTEFAKK